MGGQKANGLWGLYRGAARRAGLLDEDMTRLEADTARVAEANTLIGPQARKQLFGLATRGLDGETVPLPVDGRDKLLRSLYETFTKVPLAGHFKARLIDGHELCRELAARLLLTERRDHRRLLAAAARELPELRSTLEDAIRCEDLLAILEGVLFWLCGSRGKSIAAAMADIPIDLAALERARKGFAHSGHYRGETAGSRHARFHGRLETTSPDALGRSVLSLHRWVSEERGRAPWVWLEGDILQTDVETERPPEAELRVGIAWRNDYYLVPLKSIAGQLAELGR